MRRSTRLKWKPKKSNISGFTKRQRRRWRPQRRRWWVVARRARRQALVLPACGTVAGLDSLTRRAAGAHCCHVAARSRALPIIRECTSLRRGGWIHPCTALHNFRTGAVCRQHCQAIRCRTAFALRCFAVRWKHPVALAPTKLPQYPIALVLGWGWFEIPALYCGLELFLQPHDDLFVLCQSTSELASRCCGKSSSEDDSSERRT